MVSGFARFRCDVHPASTALSPLIVAGMLVQAGALALLVVGGGAFGPALLAAVLRRRHRARLPDPDRGRLLHRSAGRARAGVYRFWRDFGFVAGALISGVIADALGAGEAIAVVAVLTAISGAWFAATACQPTLPAYRQDR
jgi:hypothetical protein